MVLDNGHYEALYEEMMDLNEENIDGIFFVNTITELKEQAVNYLKDEYFDKVTLDIYKEEGTDISSLLDIKWKGKGLYVFVGLHWTAGYHLYHITEVFELETEVDPLIFLGDKEAAEKEKKKWLEHDKYIYIVWNYNSNIEKVYYSNEPEDYDDILKSVILSNKESYIDYDNTDC
ncbi:hypothetical protein RGU12_08225 [Fredinandcohnia sp. QZ13]|uniref:hypothetical protein n=1 Tax=Fredinandcohnia sp. QZ13 TaxID=3073144 RepID=UPI002852FEA7|nr:hypothetical protein [Fredinandcohnia sp. QZ13]MDR4887547.1 hypothetical protein [Fredinandcohnia sp. QZ13]